MGSDHSAAVRTPSPRGKSRVWSPVQSSEPALATAAVQLQALPRVQSWGATGGIGAAIIGSAHYDSGAVLKLTRDCIMLGSSMRRVGLIDIMVGNRARLGAS